ncbi:hypothetical protein ACFFRR_009390 [Megaselia abdita]
MGFRPLNSKLQKIAEQELNEVPSRVESDVKVLREWIEKQPHLNARTSDQFLIAFLRGCKFSLEKAKQKIDLYYTLRALTPELFTLREVNSKTLELLRVGCLLRLPKPMEEDGPRIYISKYGNFDPKKYKLADFLKLSFMMSDIQILEDDNAMVKGFIEIVDMTNISFGHLLQFDPSLTKKVSVLGEKAMPFRIKGIHFINIPSEAQSVINLGKKLLSDKMKQRFVFHGNLESLYEVVPRKYLPKEYGGENGTFDEVLHHWEQKLSRYKSYFEDDKLYGTNEKLRCNSNINTENILGTQGSFRKLEVD